METEERIKKRLEKRELQKQGKVQMGHRVNHANIDGRILELKWVLEK